MNRFTATIVGLAILVAACGDEAENPSSDPTSSKTVSSATQLSAPVSSASPDSTPTTAPSEPPSTLAGPITTSTEIAAEADASTSTIPVETTLAPASPVNNIAAIVNGYFVVADVQTGDTSFSALVAEEASWAVDLELSADASRAYFTLWFEDWWYSCDASTGAIYSTEIGGDGRTFEFAQGRRWVTTRDGAQQAFISSDTCLPDPEEPDLWVLIKYDTVVFVDQQTGDDIRIGLGLEPQVEVIDVLFAPDGELLVLLTNGEVRKLNPSHALVADAPVYGHPGLPGDPWSWSLVAFDHDLGGLLVSATGEGQSSVVAIAENGSVSALREDVVAMDYRLVDGQFVEVVFGQLFVDGTEVQIPAQDELGESYVNDAAWVPALG